jgi:hypothetical protein
MNALKILARFIFETSPCGPFLTALAAGYAVAGPDGQIYLTDAGQEYLNDRPDTHRPEREQ